MNKSTLRGEYLDWMIALVSDKRYMKRRSYTHLLNHLHDVDFRYTIAMDGNRAEDGINLRYRFGYEHSYPDSMIASCLDDRPCSVLEMLIALSHRCEEQIMSDPEIGDRTGQWFWDMIANLKLDCMSDDNFDPAYVEDVIERFMDRKYDSDGNGGLFTIEHCKYDMRSVEIWYQMNWYIDKVI